MEFELVWFANTRGRHAIWWMKPTWSHVKFGPRSWEWFTNLAEKTPGSQACLIMTFKFFTNFTVFHPLGLPSWLMWNHWAFFSTPTKLERWILGTDMGPLEGAPTIWIGVGLGHFPSPRGCSDDAWASSCFFSKGAEEFVVPRTGNEKCLKHGVLALIA